MPLILTLLAVSVFGWFLNWLYRDYALEHDNIIAHYLQAIELRQLISLLIVSKGFYDTDSDAQGQSVSYFPKVRIKFLFKTGQIILEEPVDVQKYMERFSKGEFDNTVEIGEQKISDKFINKLISVCPQLSEAIEVQFDWVSLTFPDLTSKQVIADVLRLQEDLFLERSTSQNFYTREMAFAGEKNIYIQDFA